MKWLYLILRLFFCKHRWQFIKTVKTYEFTHDARPIRQHQVVRCIRCGKFRKWRI